MLNSMVNAQPCTMGAIIDYTVGIHTKSSPRALDIQKAQEELRYQSIIHLLFHHSLLTLRFINFRHNCDAREERTRGLRFLEKVRLRYAIVHIGFISLLFTCLLLFIAIILSCYLLSPVYCREATHYISNLPM
jgi:hypothetical protein